MAHGMTPVVVAADATHKRGMGAWAAVFADGRTVTGAGPTIGINDAEMRGATLAIVKADSSRALIVLTDSASLLQAFEVGGSKLTRMPGWLEFRAAADARRDFLSLRRCATEEEKTVHEKAHHLAAAAWQARDQDGELSSNLHDGWRDKRLSSEAIEILHTCRGAELRLAHTPAGQFARNLDYELARAGTVARVQRISARHFVLTPVKTMTADMWGIVRRIAKDAQHESR